MTGSLPPLLPKVSFRYLASVVSGLLLFVSFPLPNWHLLVWVSCLPLILALVSESKPRRGYLLGYLSGLVFLLGSCYWIYGVIVLHGGVHPVLALGALILFAAIFAVFLGAFGLLETWVAQASVKRALLLSPFLWVALELARTYLITGFPWNLLGYAVQADGLRQLASVTAVYGLSFLAVATSAWLAAVFVTRGDHWPRYGLAAWLLALTVANWLLAPPPPSVGSRTAYLVQPNVPLVEAQLAQWLPWRDPTEMERLVEMTAQAVRPGSRVPAAAAGQTPVKSTHDASAPLIVWPENPAPFYYENDPIFRAAIETMARRLHSYVVVGTTTFADAENRQPRNSAVLVDPSGNLILRYDKIHLVPFGEYVPPWAFPDKIGKITLEAGNFVPGRSFKVARIPPGGIGIFICYEAIFPQLVRKITAAGAEALVNISNDAWYGSSSAAYQHLEMARVRAIENRRFILRATNDGVTAVIDPYGRMGRTLPRHQAGVLEETFEFQTARAFYTKHGDVWAWLSVAVSIALIGSARRKYRVTRSHYRSGFRKD